MGKKVNIVWITTWYPHEGEPYVGDFIQRHAQAISAFVPLTVYSCHEHPTVNKIEIKKNGNLTEVTRYFKALKTGIKKVDNIIYWIRWYWILKRLLIKHKKEQGTPNLLHCHVTLNAGWLGLFAKRKWNVPFIVTEHWSGYLPEVTHNNYQAYNGWSKKKFKKIIRQVEVVTAVSKRLIKALRAIEPAGNFVRIANVVNENIFNYRPNHSTNSRPTFIHISTLNEPKNAEGILQAIALVKEEYPEVLLNIVGSISSAIADIIVRLNIENNIQWIAEMAQDKLAEQIRGADALILFSRYETFGCVVIEANAVGVPVIVSDIDSMKELVKDEFNGLLAEEGNATSLAGKIKLIVEQKIKFNAEEISKATLSLFSYPIIGKQFFELYTSVLEKASK